VDSVSEWTLLVIRWGFLDKDKIEDTSMLLQLALDKSTLLMRSSQTDRFNHIVILPCEPWKGASKAARLSHLL